MTKNISRMSIDTQENIKSKVPTMHYVPFRNVLPCKLCVFFRRSDLTHHVSLAHIILYFVVLILHEFDFNFFLHIICSSYTHSSIFAHLISSINIDNGILNISPTKALQVTNRVSPDSASLIIYAYIKRFPIRV